MKRNSTESFGFEKIKRSRKRTAFPREGSRAADEAEEADGLDLDGLALKSPHRKPGASRNKRDYRKSSAAKHQSFRCRKCRAMIGAPFAGGSQRNHCPLCLHSAHVDVRPGDRSANCGSTMEPISIWVRGGEWVLLHRCLGCGVIHSNRIAADDNEIALMSLAARPLGRPAFPLYHEEEVGPE